MATFFEKEFETPDMETLASLAENLIYRLPGCTDIMVRKTIQEVYRDFCRRSCCLRVRRQFTLEAGNDVVNAIAIYGGIVDSIVEVVYNGRRLIQGRDYVVKGARAILRNGLIPRDDSDPSSLPTIVVQHVEIPSIGQESVPSWFVQKYGDYVCNGVLARLQAMTGRPWSDAQMVHENVVRFENGISEARLGYYSESDGGNGDTGFGIDTSGLI